MTIPSRATSRRAALLLLTVATLHLAAGAAARAAEPQAGAAVPVRGGSHPGFDRLTLVWPSAVAPRFEREGEFVLITFPSRDRLDLKGVPSSLGGRIIAVRSYQDRAGTALAVKIRPDTAAKLSMLPGNRMVLDVADAEAAPGAS